MNERIQELAGQCEGRTICECGEVGFNFDKFAELIVEECRYVMDCNKGSDQNPAWNQALSETSEKIKQHFGVEE
jgi:hypothetical protein